MPQRSSFLLRYNGRDDNLGDQIIFQALANELALHGKVALFGRAPAWLPNVPGCHGKLSAAWFILRQRLAGRRVTHVAPPGARLGGPVRQRSQSWFKEPDRIALGFSAAPDANHDWGQFYRWLGARDDTSVNALREAGLQQVEYFPDLAFLLPASPHHEEARDRVAFSFREKLTYYDDGPMPRETQMRVFAEVVNALGGDNRDGATAYHQVEEDRSYSAAIADELSIANWTEQLTLDTYRDFYESTLCVVSNRLHCLLLAAISGALPVALTFRSHTKLVALYETVGWSELLLFFEDGPQEVAKQFQKLLQRRNDLLATVEETCREQSAIAADLVGKRAGI